MTTITIVLQLTRPYVQMNSFKISTGIIHVTTNHDAGYGDIMMQVTTNKILVSLIYCCMAIS